MKRVFPLLLAVFVAVPALRAQDVITVETKFIETSIAVTPPVDDAALARMKDADLLSGPRFTTKSGQRGTVEIIHENPLPAGAVVTQDKVNSGLTVDVSPQFQGDDIAYRIRLTKCDLVNAAGQAAGVMETLSRDLYAVGATKSGEPIWLRFATPKTGRQVLVRVKLTRGEL